MKREAIAHRSGLLTTVAVVFLGGGSFWLLFSAATALGGFEGYIATYDGRGSPYLALFGAIVCLPLMAWWLVKIGSRKTPPVYLEGDLLFAETWREPLNMTAVQHIVVEKGGPHRSYQTAFLLHDGTRRVLTLAFYQESASGIAADLGARYGLAVEDPTVEA